MTCQVSQDEFTKIWFKSKPGFDKPVQEADSITLDTGKNCNFYKWSEQMFLWLTSPATGPYHGNRVLDSQIFYQVDGNNLIAQRGFGPRSLMLRAAKSGPDGLPVVLDLEGHLREFVTLRKAGLDARGTAGGEGPAEIATVETGGDGKAVFLDARGKPVAPPKVTADMLPQELGRLTQLAPTLEAEAASRPTVRRQIAAALTAKKVLIEIATRSGPVFVEAGTNIVDNLGPGQAGGGVLISQQNSVIFYEVLVNDVYAWYLTGRKTTNGIAPFYVSTNSATNGLFPTTQPDLTSIENFSKSHGGPSSFPDGQALTVEAKLAWVDAKTLPNGAQGYITARANVPIYNMSNSADWAPAGQKPATVALVGAHIVGGAKGHPEMIWATFEHQANTPLAAYAYTSGGKTIPVSQNTSGTWLFSASNAQPAYNTELAQFGGNQHIVSPNTPPTAIGKSNILREKAWGVASDGVPNQQDKTPAASNTLIISLDTDVRSKLSAVGAGADPRFNYLLIGATWTLGGNEPTCPYPQPTSTPSSCPSPVHNEIGTSMLANSTMETFMQGPNTTFNTGTNCFSCHTSSGANPNTKANTAVSHFFGQINALATTAQTKGK